MTPPSKKLFRLGLVAVIALPLAVLITFVLFPFWSWLEKTWGIESVGHSGPAEWCFIASFGFIAAIGGALALRS